MASCRGLVMEKGGDRTCVILTPDGQFRRVPLPAGGAGVGEEIEVTLAEGMPRRAWLLVASLALAVLLLSQFFLLSPARAVAYVSLDINPSLQLAVDGEERILAVTALDEAARPMVAGLEIEGLSVDEGLEAVLKRAVEQGYLRKDHDGVVLLAVVPARGREERPLLAAEVADVTERALQAQAVPARVVAAALPGEARQEAVQSGLSPGKYALGQALAGKGKDIASDRLKNMSLRDIEAEQGERIEDLLSALPPVKEKKMPVIMREVRQGAGDTAGPPVPGDRMPGRSPEVPPGRDKITGGKDSTASGPEKWVPGEKMQGMPGNQGKSTGPGSKVPAGPPESPLDHGETTIPGRPGNSWEPGAGGGPVHPPGAGKAKTDRQELNSGGARDLTSQELSRQPLQRMGPEEKGVPVKPKGSVPAEMNTMGRPSPPAGMKAKPEGDKDEYNRRNSRPGTGAQKGSVLN